MEAPEVQDINGKHELDAWLAKAKEDLEAPPFVRKYIESTGVQPDLKIVTPDGHVTFAHQYVLANSSLYFYFKLDRGLIIMERNDKKTIKEDSISKEALVLILRLLYCNECVAGPTMEKYGVEVMVVSLLFTINSKHLIVDAMKDSITLQNCFEVWKAIETCEIKYYDDFYSHPALGLKAKCKEVMEKRLSHEGTIIHK